MGCRLEVTPPMAGAARAYSRGPGRGAGRWGPVHHPASCRAACAECSGHRDGGEGSAAARALGLGNVKFASSPRPPGEVWKRKSASAGRFVPSAWPPGLVGLPLPPPADPMEPWEEPETSAAATEPLNHCSAHLQLPQVTPKPPHGLCAWYLPLLPGNWMMARKTRVQGLPLIYSGLWTGAPVPLSLSLLIWKEAPSEAVSPALGQPSTQQTLSALCAGAHLLGALRGRKFACLLPLAGHRRRSRPREGKVIYVGTAPKLEVRPAAPRQAAVGAPGPGSCQSGPKLLTSAFLGQSRSDFFSGTRPPSTPFPHRYFELSSLSPPPRAVALTPEPFSPG